MAKVIFLCVKPVWHQRYKRRFLQNAMSHQRLEMSFDDRGKWKITPDIADKHAPERLYFKQANAAHG
ncbi:MAG TPA: hypothetical protein VFG34_04600 [Sphingopyxis sp.]|nr:hypothetical protein [Sphingopyxis sp.]